MIQSKSLVNKGFKLLGDEDGLKSGTQTIKSYRLPRMISVSVVPSDPPALIESPCPFDIETVVITRREYIELKAQINYLDAHEN